MSQFLMHTTTFVNQLAATPLWASLGWTMWYYLWIGLIELAFAGLILTLLRRTSSALRYRFLLALFALLLVTPVIIFQYASRETNAAQANIPVVLTAPTLSWVPATGLPKQDFVEPARIPNALQPPWKPEASNPGEVLRNSETPLLLVPQSAAPPDSGEIPLSLISLTNRLVAFVPWLPLLWIFGSPLTLLCLGFGLIGAERFRRQARIISAGSIVDQCAQVATRIGLNGRILIGFSERISSPILIGILKPLILLPITAETGWTPAQLEMVLLHELAHVRRWDNLVNLLQRLAEGILFFQPAVWIVSRWLTAEREHCCDELVVSVTGRAHDYATVLAELAMAEHLPPGVVSAMARHPLLGRIRRILGDEQPLQVSRGTLVVALLASVGCCTLAGLVRGVENKPNSSVESKETPQNTETVKTEEKPATAPEKVPEVAASPLPQTRNITFRITTPLGRPLPGVIAKAESIFPFEKKTAYLDVNQSSDSAGRLTIPLASEGLFECHFMEYDGTPQGVAPDQRQIPKTMAEIRIKPGEWNEEEEIPVIIGRPGRLKVELVLPKDGPVSGSVEKLSNSSLAKIHRTTIPGFGTPSGAEGRLLDLTTVIADGRLHIEGQVDGSGEVLIAYPHGRSPFETYREVGHKIPRHLQPEPPLFSSKQGTDSEPLLGVSWIEVIPVDHEADEKRTIDFNQCVCRIRGIVKDEWGKKLPKVEIRVNRVLSPFQKEGFLSWPREIPIPVWDNIPRSNDQGEFAIERMQPGKVAIYAIQSDGKASETVYADLTTDKPVEANLIIDQSKPLPETPKYLLQTIDQPAPMPIPPTPIAAHPEIPPGKRLPQKVDSALTSAPPGPQSPPQPPDAKKSPLLHIELTGDSVRVLPEQLRYDGKSFREWVEVIRTEIKTERVVEAINVMTIFGSRGYEKTAVAEIADVLRRAPQTHALRASMEFFQVMSASTVAFQLLGPAAIPELIAMLNSKDPHETIIALELLSPPAEDPWNWQDSLPLPSTEGVFIGRSYENARVINGDALGKGSAELAAVLKSLLKHPNAEIRARVLPAAVGCQLSAAENREMLSTVLQDPDPAVWFSAMGMVGQPTPLKYPREALKESYRKLKESKTLQTDRVRRQRFLEALLSESAYQPPEELSHYLPDILDDLKATPSHKETAYWHLMQLGISTSSRKARSFRDAVRKAAAELPPDQKPRVEETLNALDPEIDRGIKQAEDRKTPKKS